VSGGHGVSFASAVVGEVDARRVRAFISAGSGLVGRPSALASIADILLHCREPPQWAQLCENVLTASFLRRSFCKDEASSANRVPPTTNEDETSKNIRVKTKIKSFHTAWARSGHHAPTKSKRKTALWRSLKNRVATPIPWF
jgi:hypothetical protein